MRDAHGVRPSGQRVDHELASGVGHAAEVEVDEPDVSAPERLAGFGVGHAAFHEAGEQAGVGFQAGNVERVGDEDVLRAPDALGAEAGPRQKRRENGAGRLAGHVPPAHAHIAHEAQREYDLDARGLGKRVQRLRQRRAVPHDGLWRDRDWRRVSLRHRARGREGR